MSTSYTSECKELVCIPFKKIRGRYDSEIHLGKLRRPSHKGKAPVEEDGAGTSESVQGEFSHPSSRGVARSSRDAEGVGHDISDLGDGSAFFDEDIVPPQAFLVYFFGEFLVVDRSKGRAHLSVVWATRRLDYLERVAWGPAIVGWLHHHLCSVARGTRYLEGCSIFLQVWVSEHITIPCPLLGRLAPSFPTIHNWSSGVWDSERIPSRLYYSLFLDTQAVGKPTFPGRVHCQLGLPLMSCEITLPWTPIIVSTIDEDAYMREMAPWIEEWRSRAARVIGEEEEEGISLSQYEDRYRALLRNIATLTEHGEGLMRELRTAYLDEGRSSTDEVASLHAKHDSAVVEQDSM
ncbi:hypothetical protein AMTR_s00031p00138370 [Amborella trichopoda]|uniref:Aminotransferase-like plant mobile domain-containing protein n=1 Tax=Amborella trichopoda TaxID=13333 RepID=U5D2V2_AMBTC|nr:hypothetical protein AMTR_s00031p00138370 [Amborella trichopoda]